MPRTLSPLCPICEYSLVRLIDESRPTRAITCPECGTRVQPTEDGLIALSNPIRWMLTVSWQGTMLALVSLAAVATFLNTKLALPLPLAAIQLLAGLAVASWWVWRCAKMTSRRYRAVDPRLQGPLAALSEVLIFNFVSYFATLVCVGVLALMI